MITNKNFAGVVTHAEVLLARHAPQWHDLLNDALTQADEAQLRYILEQPNVAQAIRNLAWNELYLRGQIK